MRAVNRIEDVPLVVRLCNWVGEVVLSVPALQRGHGPGVALVMGVITGIGGGGARRR